MSKSIFGNNIDFSKDIGQIGAPSSPNGELLVAAGQTEGRAAVVSAEGQAIKDKANAGLLIDGAKMGLDAYKGKLQSDMESQIKKTIDSYEARVKVDSATAQIDMFNSGMVDAAPEEVQAAQAQISKYKDALDQGIMTREQALLAIDKSVKEYSRTMPGWATDFRKQAATLTGVDHMGNYKEYSLLGKEGVRERLAYDQAKFVQDMQQKQIQMFVEKYGRLPAGGLQGPDMAMFREQLAVIAQTDQLKKKIEARDAGVQQVEPLVVQWTNSTLADGILTLNQKLQGIVTSNDPKTGKPLSAESKVLLRQQVLSDTNSFFENLKAGLMKFDTNQISNATRETLLTRLNTQQRELTDSLKNQDTFDDFNKTMQLRAAQAQDVMNKWAIANPHLKIIKESGMATPDVAKLWIESQMNPTRSADFRKIYGNALDDYFRSITTGGAGPSNVHKDNMIKSSTSVETMEALRTTNPGAHQAAVMQLRDHIKTTALQGWGETQDMVETRKTNFASNVEVFASQIAVTDPSATSEWTKLLADPRVAQRINELAPADAARAQSAIIMKTREIMENPEFGVLARLSRLQERVALTHKAQAFNLIQDPISGQIKVEYYPWEGSLGSQGKSRTGSQAGTNIPKKAPIVGDGLQVPDDGREIKTLVDTLNKSMAVMGNYQEKLPQELQGSNLGKDIITKFGQGYFSLGVEDRYRFLDTGKKPEKGGVNTPSPKDFPKETPEQRSQAEQSAVYARLMEVGGDVKQASVKVSELQKVLKQKDLAAEYRSILKNELKMWEKVVSFGDKGPKMFQNFLKVQQQIDNLLKESNDAGGN